MNIDKTVKVVLITFLAVLLLACVGTVSSIDGDNPKIYIMSEQVANRVMMSAMKAEIDKENIQNLPAPQLGYSGKVQFGIDRDTITLFAKSAIGKDETGNEVRGYIFEAKHSGTAPAAGAPTVERLLTNVVKDAKQIGQEASFIRLVE
ncbi:MAG: hypothetical protein V7459_13170 [Oceanicoccus sp.]